MPISVLFVHGGDAGSFDADRILADRLQAELGPNFDVVCPQMPDEDEPDYLKWKAFLLPILNDGAVERVAVGHSIGGSVLAKLFVEEQINALGLVLASAPFWSREGFWRWDEVVLPPDAGQQLPDELGLLLYHGIEDTTVPVDHMVAYKNVLPRALCFALPGRDHQLGNDMTDVAAGIKKLCRPGDT
jgi:uncharacterized protein